MSRKLVVLVIASAAAVSSVHGFSPFRPAASAPSAASSAQADEAVTAFAKRYPKKAPPKRFFFESWGVPARDVDGTEIKRATSESRGRAIFDIDEKQQRSTFAALAEVYGEDSALQMIRDAPGVLAFRPESFGPTFRAWSGIFGEEETRGMVARNPNLLAVTEADAAESNEQTMQFSYILSATRPIGPYINFFILVLLLLPAAEQITGIPIRAQLLGEVFYKIPTLPPDTVFGS
mmetsp:Transcript_48491/g.146288  ORF Transcript_48491/g.146288 Transcript_48491/m.146288 type:complete len:234 (-) Transcript_48491:537-1238(-)